MANTNYFSGSTVPISGSTPFGFYDTDSAFQHDGPKVAVWCAQRLGWPVVNIELNDVHFYSAFEEAINEYGAQINQVNIKDNLYDVKGAALTGQSLNNTVINGSGLNTVVSISQEYGTEIGVGGNVSWHTGSIDLTPGVQNYDLNALFRDVVQPGKEIEVVRVFHTRVPASVRQYDPWTGGAINFQSEFGFNSFVPMSQFLLMPMYETLLRIQAIELNDIIRRSAYSFEIVNNNIRLFPIPQEATKLWFEYILTDERANRNMPNQYNSGSVITDYSNIPYTNLTYTTINAVGKQWIRRYTLAVVKEVLGNIRSKFANIPIADGEISMDGETLRTEATVERENLIEELRTTLEETSKKAQMEARSDIAVKVQEQLSKIPTFIYIG